MANPFVAEIRIFPFDFPPRGWAFCNGQLTPISQNTALFSLLGTTYGGDGRSSFALPNLQGRVPLNSGQAPGLSSYDIGQQGGAPQVTLLVNEMPVHNHPLHAENQIDGNKALPAPNTAIARTKIGAIYQTSTSVQMSNAAVAPTGGIQAHNNMMPYLALNYCIALQGVFPQRG
jgi:microcystin-dependent protein